MGRRSQIIEAVRKAYVGLTAFLLLEYLGLMTIGYEAFTPVSWTLRCISVPLAVYCGRLWKDKNFWLLAAYYLWFSIRMLFSGHMEIMYTEGWISELSGLWVFTACYGLGRVLDEKRAERFFLAGAAVWTAGMAVSSALGIFAAWTDQIIPGWKETYMRLGGPVMISDLGYAFWGFEKKRLTLMAYSTISGVIQEMSLLIAMIAFGCSRSRAARKVYGTAILLLTLALALTDARTSFIALAAGVGVLALIGIQRGFEKRQGEPGRDLRTGTAWAISGGLSLLIAVTTLLGMIMLIHQFNQIKLRGLIPRAYAEAGVIEAASRGFNFTADMFTGRVEIWQAALQMIQEDPLTLLLGTSKLGTMFRINEIVGMEYGHCHNMILEILVESGIPGLALTGVFLGGLIRKTCRMMKSPETPLWLRLLPAVMVSLWVTDLDECFVWLRHGMYPMLAFQFVIFGFLASYGKRAAKK